MRAWVAVDGARPGVRIPKELHGHFSEHLGRCIYQGLFVGENSPIPNEHGMRTDVVKALKEIGVPLLRWPGGCFADEYHWRDGIGPREARKRMVNTHWGGVVEDNTFGTHEFLELCRQIGCEPYINANLGSGTVQEMSEWVEYLNSDGDSTVAMERWKNGHREPYGVRYWGVGNENWGCGGNMTPEMYADLYRRYQTYCRDYGEHKLFRIACGPSDADWHWTEVLMQKAGRYMDGLTLHSYTVPSGSWAEKGSATEFDEARYMQTLARAYRMDALIRGHLAIMDRYDPEHRVKLMVDEWGCWHDVEPGTNPGFLYQQNTMRDAMVAALTLDVFHRYADRLGPCCIAQMVNVLQSVVLTEGDRMLVTPTGLVFMLYKAHQEAQSLEQAVFCDRMDNGLRQLSVSASRREDTVTLTLTNLHPAQALETEVRLDGVTVRETTARMIRGDMHAMNTFEDPEHVRIEPLEGIRCDGQTLSLTLPACSVCEVTVRV